MWQSLADHTANDVLVERANNAGIAGSSFCAALAAVARPSARTQATENADRWCQTRICNNIGHALSFGKLQATNNVLETLLGARIGARGGNLGGRTVGAHADTESVVRIAVDRFSLVTAGIELGLGHAKNS